MWSALQIYRLDVSQIAECCPNLEDLTAKVTVEDESKSVPLQNLQVAKVRITDPSTFSWIMRNSPNIQRFEVNTSLLHYSYLFIFD